MEEANKENTQKKAPHYRGAGGMYQGIDVPVKLLDAVILAGIALIAVLIFA